MESRFAECSPDTQILPKGVFKIGHILARFLIPFVFVVFSGG